MSAARRHRIAQRIAMALALVPAVAAADPDLHLHHQPPRLSMRHAAPPISAATTSIAPTGRAPTTSIAPTSAAPTSAAPTTVAQVTGPAPGATTSSDNSVDASFSPVPRSFRDLAERVTLHVRAGVDLENAPAGSDPLRGGAALPAGFAESRPWIVGDAMLGARDLLLPSLGGYFLSSFQFDASDSIASRSAVVGPSDATGQHIAIKAGYVEWGNDDRRPQDYWVRGGRQFRLDAGSMFAYFDGVTGGYRKNGVDASAFVGRRVALYVDTPAGLEFGATAAVDLKVLRGTPVRVALDYMGLAIDVPGAMPNATDAQLRQLIAFTGSTEPNQKLRAELRARFVDGGTGMQLGRVGGRVKFSATSDLLVIGDIEQRQGGDLAYDLASPSAVDVVDVARRLGVGLAAPIDALTVGARVDWRHRDTEVLAFGRAEVAEETPTQVDQHGWFEGGAAVAGQVLKGVYLTGQYTLRKYVLETPANQPMSAFGDTGGTGLDILHELAVDAWLRSQTRGGSKWRAGVGGFYRIYDLVTPYRTASNDGRGGGRVELQWWFTQAIHAEVAGEIAESSPVLARELGTLSSVRAALEARW